MTRLTNAGRPNGSNFGIQRIAEGSRTCSHPGLLRTTPPRPVTYGRPRPMPIPLAILDLAPIATGQTARDSFEASVALARAAERSGYRRVWYAEHHNMPTIASSATSVLIG